MCDCKHRGRQHQRERGEFWTPLAPPQKLALGETDRTRRAMQEHGAPEAQARHAGQLAAANANYPQDEIVATTG